MLQQPNRPHPKGRATCPMQTRPESACRRSTLRFIAIALGILLAGCGGIRIYYADSANCTTQSAGELICLVHGPKLDVSLYVDSYHKILRTRLFVDNFSNDTLLIDSTSVRVGIPMQGHPLPYSSIESYGATEQSGEALLLVPGSSTVDLRFDMSGIPDGQTHLIVSGAIRNPRENGRIDLGEANIDLTKYRKVNDIL